MFVFKIHFMGRAEVLWASPVASHSCAFGTICVKRETIECTNSLARCLDAFLPSVQGCDATMLHSTTKAGNKILWLSCLLNIFIATRNIFYE